MGPAMELLPLLLTEPVVMWKVAFVFLQSLKLHTRVYALWSELADSRGHPCHVGDRKQRAQWLYPAPSRPQPQAMVMVMSTLQGRLELRAFACWAMRRCFNKAHLCHSPVLSAGCPAGHPVTHSAETEAVTGAVRLSECELCEREYEQVGEHDCESECDCV